MIKITVKDRATYMVRIEAILTDTNDAIRAARALFNEFPLMSVSIDGGNGEPVEHLISGTSSMPIVRSQEIPNDIAEAPCELCSHYMSLAVIVLFYLAMMYSLFIADSKHAIQMDFAGRLFCGLALQLIPGLPLASYLRDRRKTRVNETVLAGRQQQ